MNLFTVVLVAMATCTSAQSGSGSGSYSASVDMSYYSGSSMGSYSGSSMGSYSGMSMGSYSGMSMGSYSGSSMGSYSGSSMGSYSGCYSMDSAVPSTESTSAPTSEPTVVSDITVGITQELDGFPSLANWTDNPQLSVSYRASVAERMEVDVKFISEVVAEMALSSRRRLTAAGLYVHCNASIPTVLPGSTDADVASLVYDELTSVIDGQDFLGLFNETVYDSGQMDPATIDDTLGLVTLIETEPVTVVSSAITDAPTRAPTTSPDDDEDDVTAIMFGSVFGCVGLLTICVAYMNRDYLCNTYENQLESIDNTHGEVGQTKPFMYNEEL